MSKGCVIFDFDGVIADTEALHHQAYNLTFAAHAKELGGAIEIPQQAYFGKYIVYGDREGFFHMLRDHGKKPDDALIEKLSARKHEIFSKKLGEFAEPLPGVRDVLEWLEQRNVPRGICSGARRGEIEMLLEAFELRHHFDVMVTIEDVCLGKPDPQGYELAFDKLNLEYDAELDKEFSLVIEDSAGGCAAGRAAGLRVLAVANSLPETDLRRCTPHVTAGLDRLEKSELAAWLGIREAASGQSVK